MRLWCKGRIKRIISHMSENSSDSATMVKGRHFDSSIIILCVWWYITYKLRLRSRFLLSVNNRSVSSLTIW